MERRLPNGWKQPTFLYVDEIDGSLSIEWCFDDYRVAFWWNAEEGAMTCKTMHGNQICEEVSPGHMLAK